MGNLALFLAMFLVGAVSILQPSINARLAQKVGVLSSAAVSFTVGALALLFLVAVTGQTTTLRGLGQASCWEVTGGFIGAVYVSATIVAVPRLGTAAQLSAGLALDHLGGFGLREIAIDWRRFLGVVLLVVGAALVYRR